jgi:predicted RNase H-like HicB family nuclease
VTNFHVIYRQEPDRAGGWSTYSYPVGVYAAGATLDEAREQFREAAHFGVEDFDDYQLIEHIEEPLIEGAFIRTCIDRRTLDRHDAAKLFRTTMDVATQRADFEGTAPLGGSGDAVVVAAIASDKVSWVLEQMGDHDALSVCVAGPGPMIWWSYLAGQYATIQAGPAETLANGGLTTDSTLSELIRQKPGVRKHDGRAGEGFQRGILVSAASS